MKDEARLRLGDIVVVRKRNHIGFGLVVGLGYRKAEGMAVKVCRRVRWANIRTGRARAVLANGLRAWGEEIQPVYRDTPLTKRLTNG